MRFTIAYLLFGLVTLILVGIEHLWGKGGSMSSFLWRRRMMSALDAMNDLPQPWHYRLTVKVVVPLLTGLLIALAWPVALIMRWREWRQSRAIHADVTSLSDNFDTRSAPVLPEHLRGCVTLEEVERAETVTDPLGGSPCLPFGHLHSDWLTFKAALRPNDELWRFEAPSTNWSLTSVGGYAGVREGQIGPVMYAVVRRRVNQQAG